MAFLDDVDVDGFAHGNVVEQGQDEVRSSATRIDRDRRRQAMAERCRADQPENGSAPGVTRRDVPSLTVFAKNGICEVNEPLSADHGRELVKVSDGWRLKVR